MKGDETNDYTFYKFCKECGEQIHEDIYDDNDGLCDFCYINTRNFEEVHVGNSGY